MNDKKTKRKKRAQVHLQLDPDMVDRIRMVASADGRTVTNWIERLITKALETKEG